MTNRIALVTGANKGIGFEIARALIADHGMTVLIGARDPIRGKEAAAELGGTAVHLDVTDPASIAALAATVDRLDVLVNNAGILLERGAPPSATPVDMLRETFEVNVFGVVAVTNALLPALRRAEAARIVNLSSGLGSLAFTTDPSHVYAQNPLLAYNSSKTALNAVTVSYANELRGTPIKVNAADPGYCATDLNHHSGPRTPAQGAIAAVRLATLPADGPTGGFFAEDGPVAW
ncbi:SDR family NAD(P)-dependent oxidoreductase [Dactylosporangium fulvum]|uniref:SDR family oxidoreductase n=1 Tax=Dactylosporangium fulvum TaxID=53359 RepID=A0ABY5W447_9ACTN|nr:SDR family oxidoreductase [Dactylosporangium fulvum]UWP84165.1 SDR family oxidoreductase [Dactylosporangium fulvum]